MAEYIRKIRTTTGDKEIDYEALANKPSIPSVEEVEANKEAAKAAMQAAQDAAAGVVADREQITANKEGITALTKTRSSAIVQTATGTSIVAQDSSDDPVRGLRVFGRTTQDGTPTPDAPVPLVSVGDSGNVEVSITDGTEDNVQSLTLPTPNGLPGIPVNDSSLANYTDESGQMWCSDEMDFERGVYVQRIYNVTYDGSDDEVIIQDPCNLGYRYNTSLPYAVMKSDLTTGQKSMNSNFLLGEEGKTWSKGNIYTINNAYYNRSMLYVSLNGNESLEEFKMYLAEKPMTVLAILATPIETPLTESELSAYQFLHSNYPVTTVLNDAGAHMEFSYNADPKNYIAAEHAKMETAFDAKLAEIIALLPAETQAAMIDNETTNLLNESEE